LKKLRSWSRRRRRK